MSLSVIVLGSCGPETVLDGEPTERSPRPVGFVASEYESDSWPRTRGEAIYDVSGLMGAGRGFYTWTYRHSASWPDPNAKELVVGRVECASAVVPDWDYGRQVYWPQDEMVTSFAVAPPTSGATITASPTLNAPQVSYEVPQPGPAQVDLMFARAVRDINENTYNGTIPKVFHHALARVQFSALRSQAGSDEIRIRAVRLVGIKAGGTTQIDAAMVWNTDGFAAATWEFSVTNGRLDNVAINAAGTVGQSILSASVGDVFVMPQDLTGARLEIDLLVNGLTETRQMTLGGMWTAGHSYKYTIGIDTGQLDVIPIIMPNGLFVDPSKIHQFTVPADGYYAVEAWGGAGGAGSENNRMNQTNQTSGGVGGAGSYSAGVYHFTAGQIIEVQVGGAGGAGSTNAIGAGGVALKRGGGGAGGDCATAIPNVGHGGPGGGGGGASMVFLANQILVAAGGGGGGGGAAIDDIGGSGGPQSGILDGAQGAGVEGGYDAYGFAGSGRSATNTIGASGGSAQSWPAYNSSSSGGGGGGGGGYDGATGGGGNGGGAGRRYYHGSGGGGAAGASWSANSQGRYTLESSYTLIPSPPNGSVRISRLR